MSNSARVESIVVYPIKSLDGVALNEAKIVKGGALAGDREFVIMDADGAMVIGKTEPKIFKLRASFDLPRRTVQFSYDSTHPKSEFSLDHDTIKIQHYLSDYFGKLVIFKRNSEGGFPDSRTGSGPTLISRASLNTISGWYEGLNAIESKDIFRRLRSNIIIEDAPAFWEDQILPVETPTSFVPFTIGSTPFEGVGPVMRCPVPARDPSSGDLMRGFQRTLIMKREETLPAWSPRQAFKDGFYYAASKSRGREGCVGKSIKVGDTVSIR